MGMMKETIALQQRCEEESLVQLQMMPAAKDTMELVDCRHGGGVPYKVLHGEALPRGPTPYPFIYHFDRKGTP